MNYNYFGNSNNSIYTIINLLITRSCEALFIVDIIDRFNELKTAFFSPPYAYTMKRNVIRAVG